jgi:hypothetical protein
VPLTRVAEQSSAAICRQAGLEPNGKPLPPDQPPHTFLGVLAAESRFVEAIRFLAFALKKRDAVWWACACLRELAPKDAPPADKAALDAAEAWVRDPSDANRRTAFDAAQAAGHKSPAAWTALGVFWSEGSISLPNLPLVAPPDHLTAHAVASAVVLATVAAEPAKAPEKQQRVLARGLDVGRGQGLWT